MHDRGYVHRDLKAENILIRDKMKGDSDDSEPFIKVVDFGMSKHVRVFEREARANDFTHSFQRTLVINCARASTFSYHSISHRSFIRNNTIRIQFIRIRTLNLRFALEHRYNLRLQTVCLEHLAIRLPNV